MSTILRVIAVVTGSRADYNIYLSVLRRIDADPDLKLHLIVTGTHLAPEFGLTVTTIEDDGFAIADRIEMLVSSDTPEGIAKSMGLGTIGFAQSYARSRPDILLVSADRSSRNDRAKTESVQAASVDKGRWNCARPTWRGNN